MLRSNQRRFEKNRLIITRLQHGTRPRRILNLSLYLSRHCRAYQTLHQFHDTLFCHIMFCQNRCRHASFLFYQS